MEKDVTRILWSGITGRTGREAMKIVRDRSDISIVAGLNRSSGLQKVESSTWGGGINEDVTTISQDADAGLKTNDLKVDVIVDFSSSDAFCRVIELSKELKRPLVIGTSGLSNIQLIQLEDVAKSIPVFRDINCHFKLKRFIDSVIEQGCGKIGVDYQGREEDLFDEILLYVHKKIFKKTSVYLPTNVWCDCIDKRCEQERYKWQAFGDSWGRDLKIQCEFNDPDELAHDVLEIAKVMAKKPVKKSSPFYTLDDLWPDLAALS